MKYGARRRALVSGELFGGHESVSLGHGLAPYLVRPLFLLVLVAVVAALLALFLRTDLGLAMRATGANPRMARAQGIRVGVNVMAGVALSNALVALAGSLFAQTNGFADVTAGIGTIVVGLAAVIAGETLLPWRNIYVAVAGCCSARSSTGWPCS